MESELEADQKNMNLWEQRKFLVDYRAAAAAASASCSDSACDGAACTENDGILRKRCLCWFVKEMEFASKMLTLDARNNSAWSFRYDAYQVSKSIAQFFSPDLKACYCRHSIQGARCLWYAIATRLRATRNGDQVALFGGQLTIHLNLCDDFIHAFLSNVRNLIEQCAAMPHNEPCWNVLRSYFFTERQMLSEQQNLAKAFTYSWNDSRFVSKV